jgi:hypothetical protein
MPPPRRQIVVALPIALMACYLLWVVGHLHDSTGIDSAARMESLLHSQAATIVRLKQQLSQVKRQMKRETEAKEAPRPEQPSTVAVPRTPEPPTRRDPPSTSLAFSPSETFLLATRASVAPGTAKEDPSRVIRGLLGVARLLNRTLILPPGAVADALLDGSHADEVRSLGLRLRPASVLETPLAEELKCSHVRLETPRGLDSEQLVHALRHYATTRIVELDLPHESYCGPSARASKELSRAETQIQALVSAAGTAGPALLGHCLHSLREEEVSMYWDLGKCHGHRVRINLPDEVAKLPKGSDLMVTFSTGGVATMAHNWVAALAKAGVREGGACEVAVAHCPSVGRTR